MDDGKFFRWGSINQPVNTWLCIILMSAMCYWTVWYFFRHINEVIGNAYAADSSAPVDGL